MGNPNFQEANRKFFQELYAAAKKVREYAYAPYSHFSVGAAILSSEGEIFTGCNVENASYGLSVCAERVAVFKAVSQGCSSFRALVLVTDGETPASPCGACRQVLAEFSPELEVFMCNLKGKIVHTTVEKLLPYTFRFKKAGEEYVK